MCSSVVLLWLCAMVLDTWRTNAGLHAAGTMMRQIYVSRSAQLWSRNLTCCFTTPPVSHDTNWKGTSARRKDLIGILLTPVTTVLMVMVGLEDNSSREMHSWFPSSQANSLHSKSWSQASVCILSNIYAAIVGYFTCQIIRSLCMLLLCSTCDTAFLRDIGNIWKKFLLRLGLCV